MSTASARPQPAPDGLVSCAPVVVEPDGWTHSGGIMPGSVRMTQDEIQVVDTQGRPMAVVAVENTIPDGDWDAPCGHPQAECRTCYPVTERQEPDPEPTREQLLDLLERVRHQLARHAGTTAPFLRPDDALCAEIVEALRRAGRL